MKKLRVVQGKSNRKTLMRIDRQQAESGEHDIDVGSEDYRQGGKQEKPHRNEQQLTPPELIAQRADDQLSHSKPKHTGGKS